MVACASWGPIVVREAGAGILIPGYLALKERELQMRLSTPRHIASEEESIVRACFAIPVGLLEVLEAEVWCGFVTGYARLESAGP
jgi:hypothetical protein